MTQAGLSPYLTRSAGDTAAGSVVSITDDGDKRYLLYDGQDSTLALLTPNQQITHRYCYDPDGHATGAHRTRDRRAMARRHQPRKPRLELTRLRGHSSACACRPRRDGWRRTREGPRGAAEAGRAVQLPWLVMDQDAHDSDDRLKQRLDAALGCVISLEKSGSAANSEQERERRTLRSLAAMDGGTLPCATARGDP